jgi:hypothetical protein
MGGKQHRCCLATAKNSFRPSFLLFFDAKICARVSGGGDLIILLMLIIFHTFLNVILWSHTVTLNVQVIIIFDVTLKSNDTQHINTEGIRICHRRESISQR